MVADDIQKRLGENLKRIRKSKNLTQFQLAELADISEETVKNIELCRCWTSEKNLAKITEALNIDVHKLFLPIESSIHKDSEDIVQIKQIEGFKSGLNIGADGKEYRTITLFAKIEKVKDKKETLNINQMVGDIPTENLDFGVDSIDDFTIDEIDFD